MQTLIGTWALISTEWRRADGRHANPFGADATGILTYDAAGYMSAQIMRADRPALPADHPETLDAAFAAAVAGYIAYFGTYEADEAARTVTHNVVASTFPAWVGGTQQRNVTFEGNTLTLSADLVTSDSVAVAASTTWRRVG